MSAPLTTKTAADKSGDEAPKIYSSDGITEWYYRQDGSIDGPLNEKELKAKYVGGEIDDTTEIWDATNRTWFPFLQIDLRLQLPAEAIKKAATAETQNFKGRLWRRCLLLIMCGLFAALTFVALRKFGVVQGLGYSRVLFVAYLGAFVGLWLVYFMSRMGPALFQVMTLRRLLRKTSAQWNETSELRKTELEKAFQEKARTTITATAMLVAASGVALTQVSQAYRDLQAQMLANPDLVPPLIHHWDVLLLSLAAMAAFIAVVCFILSVDALDVLFNRFDSRAHAHRLRFYFYMSTINPRYFGLLSLLSAAILLIGHADPLLGCAAIGLMVTIGYRHWFPPQDILVRKVSANDPGFFKLAVTVGSFLLRVIAVLAPPVLVALDYFPAAFLNRFL